ncbi:MAG TPA: hypothetical protein VHG71_04660 [Verrucomicrobiae bacterium]|nr:hypothetical protein [Verrucomicrobiae bacterium]
MAGTIIEGQLTRTRSSTIRFALATEEDDAAIRRLLRENPMRGAINVSFEREPNYFHSVGIGGADDQTILAFEKGRLVCMGRCSIRDRYANGETCRVGYLSDLRLDSSAQGRFDILRRGYQFFHELHQDNPADFYFTSVTADNSRSLRFLQRGLPGMPIYKPFADFVTLLIPVPRYQGKLSRLKSKEIKSENGSQENLSELVNFLNTHASRCNLSTVWDEEKILSLENHGLRLSDFNILFDDKKIIGCAAVWDQRDFKQVVIREYSRQLSFARPFINFAATLFNTPKLPPLGSTLAHGFLSPLVTASDDKESLLALVESSLHIAAERGMEFLSVGFVANDPRLAVIRNQFRCREYRNRFFQVRWPDSKRLALNNNLIFPEVALL